MPQRKTKRGAERTPLSGDADVLICGASFAGLAVARELAGAARGSWSWTATRSASARPRPARHPPGGSTGWGLDDSIRQTFGDLVVHTPHGDARYRLPFTFSTFDYRQLCGLLAAQGEFEFETAKVDGRTGGDGPHRPRRRVRPADRGRAGLAARAGRRRLPAARRPALARPRGAPARRRRRPRDLDRPPLRAGGLRLELPARGRRGAHRRRLLRPALPREGHDRAARRGPRRRPGPLPGQLDPAPAARRHRGRDLLRRRLGGPLPAADRRGHPHGLLLRDRVRPRAARRGRGPPRPRGRYAATTTSAPSTSGSSAGCCAPSGSCRACRRAAGPPIRAMGTRRFVDWSFGHYLRIAPPEFAGERRPAPARVRAAAKKPLRSRSRG